MGVEFPAERGLLAEDELGRVRQSHYPELGELGSSELVDLARHLRERRDRERDLIRDLRRARRGKGGTGAGTSSERGLAAKKQVYARAVKRVNARIVQLSNEAKRQRALTEMHAAMGRLRAAEADRSWVGNSAGHSHAGMSSRPNRKPRPIIQGGRIGSVSQAGRVAQGVRDARG
jgi:hypothetical protein